MPVNAHGIAKQVRYKAEVTWNVAPAAAGAQLLRRVTFAPKLAKSNSESGEIVSHRQRSGTRHGGRGVEMALSGKLSPGTYKDFMAAAVRRAFTTVTAIAGASITIAGAGPTYTVTRAAGSWLTDGVKVGQVGRLTAGTFNAANSNKNLAVLVVTALVLTVIPMNGVALVAEGPIAAATWTMPGKVTYAPATGHTDVSFAFEDWHSDVSQSELFTGNKVGDFGITVPQDGNVEFAASFMGADQTSGVAAYFTTPTAESSTTICHSADGVIVAATGELAYITGLSLSVKDNLTPDGVVGSRIRSSINQGQILVDGQVTAFFPDAQLRDYFINETQVSIFGAFATAESAASDFVSFAMPLAKFNAADKDDGDKSIVRTLPFTADYNAAGGTGVSTEQTSIYIQDSQA